MNGRVVFGLLGVYRRPIAKEPSYVFCVSVIVIDRSELEASKTSRLANSSQGKEQTTDGKWYTSGVLTRNEKWSRSFLLAKDKEIAEAGSTENKSPPDPASSRTTSGK